MPSSGGSSARSSRASSARASRWSPPSCASVDKALAEEHYAEHADKPFFGELVSVPHPLAGVRDDRRGPGRQHVLARAQAGRRHQGRRRRARHDPRRLRHHHHREPRPRVATATRAPPARSPSGSPAGPEPSGTRRCAVSSTDGPRAWPLIPIVVVALAAPAAVRRSAGRRSATTTASTSPRPRALRAGGRPFADVFSSQGPAFLPLLWLADVLGLRSDWGPRLLPLAAGVALDRGRLPSSRLSARPIAWGRPPPALLVATSGCVLFSDQPDRGRRRGHRAGGRRGARGGRREPPARHRGRGAARPGDRGEEPLRRARGAGGAVARRRGGGAGARRWPSVPPPARSCCSCPCPGGSARSGTRRSGCTSAPRTAWTSTRNVELMRLVFRHRDASSSGWRRWPASGPCVRWLLGRPRLRAPDAAGAGSGDLAGGAVDLARRLGRGPASSTQPLFLQHLAIVVPPAALLVGAHRPPAAVIVLVFVLLLPTHASRQSAGDAPASRRRRRARGDRASCRASSRAARGDQRRADAGLVRRTHEPGIDRRHLARADRRRRPDHRGGRRRPPPRRTCAACSSPPAGSTRSPACGRALTDYRLDARIGAAGAAGCATGAGSVRPRAPADRRLLRFGYERSRLILHMRPTVDPRSTFRPRPCTSTLRRTPGGS